ncbi:LPXTG cell wall anchor domain-containing protein [Vagococcus lutrae]|uniref:LPXTG cell wall anchor domain-containing protein n=1 Tax=Vagococcus lutrae TaxID=81947 RepID=UPI00144417A9|nr:LPXTG cell wall anchor domain-containing protein [Vagococcus lutrae]NKZ27789.1 LPXTG cell wall anchor domain-containing protein [Vagococcus lutrae]
MEQITIGTGTTHLPANFLGGPFTQLHTITILGDEVTFDEDMFSFFDSTDWQNLSFFVTNENVRQRLLESLSIEKEQVKVLESLPEEPLTPTEPEETEETEETEEPKETETIEETKQPEDSDETHDVEQTEKETGTQTETSTLPNEDKEGQLKEDKEGQPKEETQEKPEKEQDDNNTPKPDTNTPLKNKVDEHTTLSSSPNNQVDVSVIHAEHRERGKKAAHSSQRLPQTSEAKTSNLLLVIGSTLLTTVATIFYKKY